MYRAPTALFLLLLCCIAPRLAAARTAPAPASLDGIWQGLIIWEPGVFEMEMLVEIAPDSEGRPVGTIDLPHLGMHYHPLEDVSLEGRETGFGYTRFVSALEEDFRFRFEGELSADGQEIHGSFASFGDPATFELRRAGEPGTERPEVPERPPLRTLEDGGGELAAAFNRDRDRVRLLLLLSPTCDSCKVFARVIERHVLDKVPGDRLAVYTLWGPMLGDETQEHAREVTPLLPDPRVTHFWTPVHDLAEQVSARLGLPASEPAWDAFLLFAPGSLWQQGPPAPASYMHVGRSLPDERRFNAVTLAEEVRELLP